MKTIESRVQALEREEDRAVHVELSDTELAVRLIALFRGPGDLPQKRAVIKLVEGCAPDFAAQLNELLQAELNGTRVF